MTYNIPQLRQNQIFNQYGMNNADIGGGPDVNDLVYQDNGPIEPYYGTYDPSSPSPRTYLDNNVDPENRPGPPQVAAEMPPQVPRVNAPDFSKPPVDPAAQRQAEYDNLMKVYHELYTPSTTATDKLNQFLSQFPDESKNQPSIARRIVASGMALGGERGLIASQKFLDDPYQTELAKWKEQAGPLQSAATLENQQNINERTLAGNFATNLTAQQRADQQNATNEQKNQIAKEVADAKYFAATHPKWTVTDKGSRLISVSPDGQQSVDLGPTTNFSPIEVQTLKNAGGLAEANVRAASSAANVAAGKEQYVQDANGNWYVMSPLTPGKAPVPAAGSPPTPTGPLTKVPTGVPETPTNVIKTQAETANQIRNEHPELKQYIKVNPNGTVEMTEPTAGFFGSGVSASLKKSFDDARKKIYPDTTATMKTAPVIKPQPGPQPTPSPSPQAGGRNQPPPDVNTPEGQAAGLKDGTLVMMLEISSGKMGVMPAEKVAGAVASKKYVQVR